MWKKICRWVILLQSCTEAPELTSIPSWEGDYAEQAEDTGLNAKAESILNCVKSLKRVHSKGQNCLGKFRLYYLTREENSFKVEKSHPVLKNSLLLLATNVALSLWKGETDTQKGCTGRHPVDREVASTTVTCSQKAKKESWQGPAHTSRQVASGTVRQ